MYINKNSIEQLKNQINIVDIIQNYIELKKIGTNYKCNCPFHEEKTPSFNVNETKGLFHCFGCGVGGDAIKFVMLYDNLPYPKAIEKIASIINFTLEYDEDLNYIKKEDYSILKKVNSFFIENLFDNKNKQVLEYLYSRGLTKDSIKKFNLGYAPSSTFIMDFFKTNNFSFDDLKKYGLIGLNKNGNEPYSIFNNRITFPIFNRSSNIVGFGARTINNHKIKYLNSPASDIFNKSKLLYGYDIALPSILKRSQIIVVEGYLDVILLHQIGISNVVATLGTAFTKEHLNLLKIKDIKVLLAYDGDEAGKNAAYKSSILLSQNNINSKVILFDNNIDPADLVKDKKEDYLKSILDFNNGINSIEYVLKQICSKFDIEQPFEKKKALEQSIEYLNTLLPFFQNEYKPFLANLLNIDEKLINFTNSKQVNNKTAYINKTKYFNTSNISNDFDILELSIIKTILILNFKNKEETLTNNQQYFLKHNDIIQLVLNKDYNHPTLTNLIENALIKVLEDKDVLKQEINLLKIKYYEYKIQTIDKKIDFEKRLNLIKNYQEQINNLKT